MRYNQQFQHPQAHLKESQNIDLSHDLQNQKILSQQIKHAMTSKQNIQASDNTKL